MGGWGALTAAWCGARRGGSRPGRLRLGAPWPPACNTRRASLPAAADLFQRRFSPKDHEMGEGWLGASGPTQGLGLLSCGLAAARGSCTALCLQDGQLPSD